MWAYSLAGQRINAAASKLNYADDLGSNGLFTSRVGSGGLRRLVSSCHKQFAAARAKDIIMVIGIMRTLSTSAA